MPVYLFLIHVTLVLGQIAMISRLWEHLEIALKLRGYTGDVKVVDAEGLEDVFYLRSVRLWLMYGAFPSNVFLGRLILYRRG